jgi:DNA polymerase/3'-5' exonuclease PolX
MNHNKSYNYELHEIPGIGPKKIEILKKKYKVKTINDLYKIDIFNTLSIESKSFLIYKPERTVSYKFIEKVDEFFHNNNIKGIIAGSYRRKKSESKDIDFISYIPFEKIKRILDANNIEIYVHSQGPDKVGAIIDIFKKRVRIDIWFPKKEERLYYLFYATGNAVFNIIMRDAAKKKGYLLNRHGLFEVKNNKRVKGIKTEKDIMAFLGKKYLKPTERNY